MEKKSDGGTTIFEQGVALGPQFQFLLLRVGPEFSPPHQDSSRLGLTGTLTLLHH